MCVTKKILTSFISILFWERVTSYYHFEQCTGVERLDNDEMENEAFEFDATATIANPGSTYSGGVKV